MLVKNAAQKIHVYAYDSTTGAAKTGDAGNITAYVSLDGTANAVDDTNPAEVDATNMPGVYVFDLTEAETDCDAFALYAKSSTSDVRLEPIIGFTTTGTAAAIAATVPDTQKVDVNTIKTQTVTCGAGVTILASVGTAATSTAQTGDSYAIINGDHGLVSIQDDIDTLLTRIVGTLLAGNHTAQSGDSYALANGDHGFVSIQDDLDTLLTRIVGTLLAGNHTAQSGDAYAVVNHATYGNAAIRTRGDAAWTTATGFSTHSAADVVTAMETNGTKLDVLYDDWLNGGRLDLLLDSVITTLGVAGAGLTEAGGTGDHLTALATAASIAALNDVSTAQVQSSCTASLNAYGPPTKAETDAAVAALLTTQMTEAYAADGVAPTVAQALFAIMQRLTEFAISSTTITVKKLDGSTTAFTLALDDATTPTSSTRAT